MEANVKARGGDEIPKLQFNYINLPRCFGAQAHGIFNLRTSVFENISFFK